jgi:hypothetical protein
VSAWTEWLSNPDAERMLLVEAKAWSGGAEVTRRLASQAYNTGPSASAPNKHYENRLTGNPYFARQMREAFGGRTFASVGGIEIDNTDGGLDDWLDDAWDGREIVLRLGDPDWDYDDFGTVLTGVIERLEVVNDQRLRLLIRDKQALLDGVLQESLVDAGENQDQPVPLAFGELYNITPVQRDADTSEYQAHAGTMQAWTETYVDGLAVSDTPNLTDGETVLGSAATGQVTADVRGYADGGYIVSPADIMRALVTAYGPLTDPDDLNEASFVTANDQAPYTLGVYFPDRVNRLDALDEVARSFGGWSGFDLDDLFEIGQLRDPEEDDSVLTLDDLETTGELRVVTGDRVRWRTQLGYKRNWTVQSSIASGVSEARIEFLKREYRVVTTEDSAIKDVHLRACASLEPTLIAVAEDAQTEADRRQALFGRQMVRYHVRCFAAPFQVRIGQVVTLTDSRYGLSEGKKCRVTGIKHYFLDNQVELDLVRWLDS